jgi:GTP-binding protein
MFIDTARITVNAGRGGNGVNSFYRDKFNRIGFPDGGDGGNGGDVIIRVSTDVHTLLDFKYQHIFRAKDGAHGSSKKQRGKNGESLVIEVPVGSLIYDAQTKELLEDLVNEKDEFIVAEGGAGGKGNRSHKDATKGEEGETKELFIELKLIADAGIIGFPNAGKSTLISRISKAHPKIAGFPFTTKSPVLGVVELGDLIFKVVEIPGLIEGSHKGKGLGDKFLRHAERTRFYMHLLDISAGDSEEVYQNYIKLNKELKLYNESLAQKPQIVVANKMDIAGAETTFRALKERLKTDIIGISAKDGTGIDKLLKKLAEVLEG